MNVEVFNRSAEPIEGVFDGRVYEVPAGKSELNRAVAAAVRNQNPILGTMDPWSGDLGLEHMLAVEAFGDTDFSPREQSDAPELYNPENDADRGVQHHRMRAPSMSQLERVSELKVSVDAIDDNG